MTDVLVAALVQVLALWGWVRRGPQTLAVHDGAVGERRLRGGEPVSLWTETVTAISPALAVPLVQACARSLQEVAMFDSAGVTDKA